MLTVSVAVTVSVTNTVLLLVVGGGYKKYVRIEMKEFLNLN